MNDVLYDWVTAPVYCNLEAGYFKNMVKRGAGPTFIKPSPRKILFRQTHLDLWMNGWVVKANPSAK